MSQNQSIDEVKRTIKDLLSLASDEAAFDGEIANAMKHASRLMTAYHLNEADLKDKPVEPEYNKTTYYSKGVSVTNWELQLAHFIDKLVGSTGHFTQHPITVGQLKKTPVVFYGIAEDVELSASLYKDLTFIIHSMARIRYNGSLRGPGREYCEGFVEGLHSKLETAVSSDMNSSSETRSLIIRSQEIAIRKKTEAKGWLAKVHNIKLKSYHRNFSGMSDPSARSTGKTDGSNLNVSATRKDKVTGSKQRRIT